MTELWITFGMFNSVFCFLCPHQTADPGSSERGRRAECGTASHALFDQSAESRERSDHCWHLRSRNLPGQLQWGPKGRSGTSLNTSWVVPVRAEITHHGTSPSTCCDWWTTCAFAVLTQVDGDREGERLLSGGYLLQSERRNIPPDPGRGARRSEAQHRDGQLAPELETTWVPPAV